MQKVHFHEWKGKNRFFWSGKLMTGSSKDNLTLGVSYSFIIVTYILYNTIITKYLYSRGYNYLPILGHVLAFLVNYYLFKTTFTDPGVIPRGDLESAQQALESGVPLPGSQDQLPIVIPQHKHSHNDKHVGYNKLVNQSDDSQDSGIEMEKPKSVGELSIYKHRHCTTCKIMRPPKSSHCSECDNCVKGFDHHCFFVGNCIGRRNHKYFFLFLFFTSVHLLFTTGFAVEGILEAFITVPKLRVDLGNQLDYWLISSGFLLIGILCCRSKICEGMRATFIAIGSLFLVLGFYMGCRELPLYYYENPTTLVGYIVLVTPLSLWVYSNCIGSLIGISLGITFKEQRVIERELGCCSARNLVKATFKDRINNIVTFFTRENVESQLHGVY